MEAEIKEKENSCIELSVKIPADNFKLFEKKALERIAERIELQGFRKGKAPIHIVRERISENRLLTETAKQAVEESYQNIVKEKELEPISHPEVQITKLAPGNDFEYKASFFVLPKINLPDYKNIASGVEKKSVLVEEKEIEDTLKWLQKAKPNLKEVFRPAQKGDFVEIHFSSPQLKNGENFEDAFILGKGRLVPGFEEQLLGMEAGEEKSFTLTLPQDFYIPEIAGKEAQFKVKVKKIEKPEYKKIDDEFAKGLGKFESLGDLKKKVEQGLKQEKELAEKKRRQGEILNKIIEQTKIDVPLVLIEREKKARLEAIKKKAEQELSLSFEEYLKKIDKKEEELMVILEKEAEARAKRFLVFREIAKKEGIGVTKEEINEEAKNILSFYSDKNPAGEEIDPAYLEEYTKEKIKNEKVLKFLENI